MHFQTFPNFLMVFLNNAKAPQGPMFDTKLNLNNEMYSTYGSPNIDVTKEYKSKLH